MARKRYITTDISIDKKIAKLCMATNCFNPLSLYMLIIPHADDFGELTADSLELKLQVVPCMFNVTVQEMEDALTLLEQFELIKTIEGKIYLPLESFYKYQKYISTDRQSEALEKRKEMGIGDLFSYNAVAQSSRAKPRTTSKSCASPSPSPSLSPLYIKAAQKHIDNMKKTCLDAAKELDLNSQANAVRMLVEIDKHSIELVNEMIDFVWQDSFWYDKAISIVSWRKKSSNGLKKRLNIIANMKSKRKNDDTDDLDKYFKGDE